MDRYYCAQCSKKISNKQSRFIKNFNNIQCHKCAIGATGVDTLKERYCTSFCSTHTIVMGAPSICVICSKTQVHGVMKMHLKGLHCLDCHYKVLYGPVKEHWAFSVPSVDSTYDTDGHRLCDIRGCNIYGPELNNDFIGFFCNIHYKEMREIRRVIKTFPDTYIEYEARMREIQIRKNTHQDHVTYVNTLYTWLCNRETVKTMQYNNYVATHDTGEASYINNMFS